jgi:hypothetical protein
MTSVEYVAEIILRVQTVRVTTNVAWDLNVVEKELIGIRNWANV